MKSKKLPADVKRTRARLKMERKIADARLRDQHMIALAEAVRYLRTIGRNGRRIPTTFRYDRARLIFGVRVNMFECVFLTDRRTGEGIVVSGPFVL